MSDADEEHNKHQHQRAAVHERAADVHERAANVHDATAPFFDKRGESGLAERDRRLAREERDAAVADRAQASRELDDLR